MSQTAEIETQESLYISEEIEYKNNFAAMNGANIEINTVNSFQEEIPEPEEIVTTRTVSQNPILKMAVIGGGIFIFIMLIGGVINGSMSALKLSTAKKIEPTQNSQQVLEEPIKDETGKDKTALALTSQSLEMKKMRDLKAIAEATPTPSPIPKSVSVAHTTPVPIRRTVVQNPTYRRDRPPSVEHLLVQPQSKPQIQYQPQLQPQPSTTAGVVKAPAIDPMQQWQKVADVGSFSAPSSESGLEKDLFLGIEGGIGQSQESKDNQVEVNNNSKRILVGSTSSGKLETPIVWASDDQSTQNYLVRITQEIKASDGSGVVPVGSYLVVQIANTNTDGYAQLYATAILVNHNGDTQEKKLPANAVRILASNGKLLKAQSGRGSDVMGMIFSAALAGVAKASEIQNRPTSSITSNSSGLSSSITTNADQDTLAGFSEGAFGSILQDIKAANETRAQSLSNQNKVYVIEAGKTVRIYVNQTISI